MSMMIPEGIGAKMEGPPRSKLVLSGVRWVGTEKGGPARRSTANKASLMTHFVLTLDETKLPDGYTVSRKIESVIFRKIFH
jgi:hypothetical protein